MAMNLKLLAAQRALEFIQSGMVLGLGTGSTTAYFIDLLGEQLRSGMLCNVLGVPTSEKTANHARSLGIPLTNLAEAVKLGRTPGLLDLVVDGADEVDPQLNLIKGLGKALLREKIVEIHTQNLIVIVDDSKMVPRLGSSVPLPVEILSFEVEVTINWLNSLGCRSELWVEDNGFPMVTDNGNHLALCRFAEGISDPHGLAHKLAERPGIIEHGLFLDMASQVIVASSDSVRVLKAAEITHPGETR
jgi:ribose 5-phosphate isomerase A